MKWMFPIIEQALREIATSNHELILAHSRRATGRRRDAPKRDPVWAEIRRLDRLQEKLRAALSAVAHAGWNFDLTSAPRNTPLLLACGGVLIGHRATRPAAGCLFVDVSGAYLRPTAWQLAPELPQIEKTGDDA